jgi:mannonate dehydratase
MLNPCRTGLPPELAQHPLMQQVWAGLDPAKVWDVHAHLVGVGDSDSGAWANPKMDSLWNPLQYIQKLFYMNAGCVHDAPGQVDASFVARLENLMDGFPTGAQILLFAFDWAHDEQGRPLREASAFHVPNAYAARVARAHPTRMQWAASIHPYRGDALAALEQAVADGARAMKWLPAAMGIDPASPRCDAFYRLLAQHDLPLITHAGHEAAVAGSARQDYGNPLKLRRALDLGVRVVVAHCASHGDDLDHAGQRRASFEIFAGMMDARQPGDFGNLYADISAVTQFNRAGVLETLLARPDWHDRLLNGSDYPLPGILPLISLDKLSKLKLLDAAAKPFLNGLREHNPLLFDFALKRLLRRNGVGFANSVFETRDFFERKAA